MSLPLEFYFKVRFAGVLSISHAHKNSKVCYLRPSTWQACEFCGEFNASTPYHSNMTSISWGHKMYELSIGIHMKCSWCSKLILRMTKHRLGEQRGSWVRVKVRHATKCPWERNSHLSSIFFFSPWKSCNLRVAFYSHFTCPTHTLSESVQADQITTCKGLHSAAAQCPLNCITL